MALTLSNFLKSINQTKEDLFENPENWDCEKDYVPFLINRCLSYHVDALMTANEMNVRRDTPNRLQYDFLRLSLRSKNRYAPWAKKDVTGNLEAIQAIFGVSFRQAEFIEKCLDEDSLGKICREYKIMTGEEVESE